MFWTCPMLEIDYLSLAFQALFSLCNVVFMTSEAKNSVDQSHQPN